MQLPRGRFERFIRGISIRDIHDELGEKKFTGCFSGIFGEIQGEIIFEKGEIILAESQDNSGSKVLFEIFSNPEAHVTAELSVYSDSQTKLAKEFNPKSVVAPEDYKAAVTSIPGQKSAEKAKPEQTEKAAFKSPDVISVKSAGNILDKKADEQKEEKEEELILSINQSEIDSINKNFRENAKEILKKIHLDHLIEKDKSGEKDNDH